MIGGPGAGKTWLAGKLGVALRHPVHELDTFPDIAAIAGQETWISQGGFLWAITPLLERADVIVVLNPPYRVAVRRIVTRHIWLSARGQNRYRGLRLLVRLAWSARRHYSLEKGRAPDGPILGVLAPMTPWRGQ